MPTVYVTYHDPRSDRVETAAVETALSFRVFRAAALVEGVELPGGRVAVLPAAIRLVSLDPPPAPAVRYNSEVADLIARTEEYAPSGAHGLTSLLPAPAPAPTSPHPPPAGAPARGGAADPRRRPKR